MAPEHALTQKLVTKLRRWRNRHTYARMFRLAAAGNYFQAACLAWSLGEHDLQRQYETLHRIQQAVARCTPITPSPAARRAFLYDARDRRN